MVILWCFVVKIYAHRERFSSDGSAFIILIIYFVLRHRKQQLLWREHVNVTENYLCVRYKFVAPDCRVHIAEWKINMADVDAWYWLCFVEGWRRSVREKRWSKFMLVGKSRQLSMREESEYSGGDWRLICYKVSYLLRFLIWFVLKMLKFFTKTLFYRDHNYSKLLNTQLSQLLKL